MDFSTAGPIALGVVLTGVVGAIAWLIRTVINNASTIAKLATKEELTAFREKVAETYVRREDYVPQVTQMNVKLDAIGTLVARIDERSKENKP